MTSGERDALIVEHLSLIKHVAHRIATRLPASVEMADLVNAGVLGLLDALNKFEPDRGVKFKTYAEVRVRGAIIDSLRTLDWAPRSLRRRGRDLERTYVDLEQKLGRPATDEEASKAIGENLDDFHALIDQLNGLNIGSFEDSFQQDDNEALINYYPDDGTNDPHLRFEAAELTNLLANAIEGLPEKERLVLSLYYYEDLTMKEIGSLLGVNESRVSQLHSKATLRLRAKGWGKNNLTAKVTAPAYSRSHH
jgi:RNA polymerase sigma factor for flagellar operon FliA